MLTLCAIIGLAFLGMLVVMSTFRMMHLIWKWVKSMFRKLEEKIE